MHFTLFLNIYVFTIQSSSVSSGALTVVDYTRSYQNSPESLKQWIFVSNYCQISQKYLLYVLYALHQFLPKRDIGYMPNFLPKFFGYFTMFLQKEIIIKRKASSCPRSWLSFFSQYKISSNLISFSSQLSYIFIYIYRSISYSALTELPLTEFPLTELPLTVLCVLAVLPEILLPLTVELLSGSRSGKE